MVWQQNAEIRRVFLNQSHTANPNILVRRIRRHYEGGDTLVVDTIGMNEKTFVDNYRTPHTAKLRVNRTVQIDRWRPDDRSERACRRSWRVYDAVDAIQRYRRTDNEPMVEMICAENNAEYFNYDVVPLPHADKADF